MTPDEARRLELARRAWNAAQCDEEAELATRRLSRRLSHRRPSRDPARRVVGIGAALIAFGAAVAYASSGGFSIPFVELRAPEPPAAESPESAPARSLGFAPARGVPAEPEPAAEPEPVPEPKRDRALRAPAVERSKPSAAPSDALRERSIESAPASPEAEPPPAEPEAASPGEASAAPAAPSASWADVSRALSEKDDARAQRALSSLGQSSDPETRAKAKLGLAQLAASRGDCDRARALARAVAGSPDADPRTAARARSLARRCQAR